MCVGFDWATLFCRAPKPALTDHFDYINQINEVAKG